jgi:hypothetical protein
LLIPHFLKYFTALMFPSPYRFINLYFQGVIPAISVKQSVMAHFLQAQRFCCFFCL